MFAILVLILFLTVLWLIELKRRKLSALVKHLPGPRGEENKMNLEQKINIY